MTEEHPAGDTPEPPLEVLLRVQELDVTLAQLERRRQVLPERERMEEAEGRLAELSTRESSLEAQRRVLADRQVALEEQVAAVSAREAAIEQRMYGVRGTPARDLQAMDDEVRHLRARRSELEDVELGVMEELEPLDAALAALVAERAPLSSLAGSLRDELAAAEAVVDAEVASVTAARTAAAARLPGPLRERYEELRARMGGVGAARLVGNRCSGCHLELPAREVDRIRRLPPGTVVTCEQCGRILVPSPPGDAGPGPSR